mmetsp:Transcript_8527/g.17964  ORF Transcript_8527/g.17964 Transcript_8527/m.17964 type:complete len:782 (+) Transcript_8527:506-2851(+)
MKLSLLLCATILLSVTKSSSSLSASSLDRLGKPTVPFDSEFGRTLHLSKTSKQAKSSVHPVQRIRKHIPHGKSAKRAITSIVHFVEHEVMAKEYLGSMSMDSRPESFEFSMMLDGIDESMSLALEALKESMSLSLEGIDDIDESMSLELIPSPTAISTPLLPSDSVEITNPTTYVPINDIPDYVKITIEYLARCANATLDLESCLVSNTIFAFESMTNDDDEGFDPTGRSRFLEEMSFDDDHAECLPPPMNGKEMGAIIRGSKGQCEASGVPVSSTVLDSTITEFTKLFKADQCWISLCEDTSNTYLKIIFHEVVSCAGADLNFDPCILDHLLGVYSSMSEPDNQMDDWGSRVRRSLRRMVSTVASEERKEEMEEIARIVKGMLAEADATCLAIGVTIEDKDLFTAFDDMLKIFGTQECWGPADYEEEPAQFPLTDHSNAALTDPVMDGPIVEPTKDGDDAPEFVFLPNISSTTGHRCSGVGNDDGTERNVEVAYFYHLETASEPSEEEEATVLNYVEQTLLASVADSACVDVVYVENVRRLEDSLVVAVDSAPKDVVSSNYTCTSQKSPSNSCHVIQGKMTLTLRGDDQGDDLILADVQKEIADSIDSVTVDNPIIVDLSYIGQDPPASEVTTAVSQMRSTDDKSQGSSKDVLFVAVSISSMLAMITMIAGFFLINKKDKLSIHEEYDEESCKNDESSTNGTAEITLATTPTNDDRSDLSSLSPANTLSPNYRKHFVVAEEEASHWRQLGVLPLPSIKGSYLEGVSEENSSVNETDEGSI